MFQYTPTWLHWPILKISPCSHIPASHWTQSCHVFTSTVPHQQQGKGSSARTKLMVTEHCNSLPREVVKTPSLDVFKIHLDTYQCSLLWGNSLSRELRLTINRGPFKLLHFCDFVIIFFCHFIFNFLLLKSQLRLKLSSCSKWRRSFSVCEFSRDVRTQVVAWGLTHIFTQ